MLVSAACRDSLGRIPCGRISHPEPKCYHVKTNSPPFYGRPGYNGLRGDVPDDNLVCVLASRNTVYLLAHYPANTSVDSHHPPLFPQGGIKRRLQPSLLEGFGTAQMPSHEDLLFLGDLPP